MPVSSNMLEKLKKMQEAVEQVQKTIELQEFVGKAGDVIIVLQGTRQVVEVIINKQNNVEILQESILLAFNHALNKLDKTSKKLMSTASRELIEP